MSLAFVMRYFWLKKLIQLSFAGQELIWTHQQHQFFLEEVVQHMRCKIKYLFLVEFMRENSIT